MNAPLLSLEKLAVGHGGRTVLDGIDLTVDAGRWVALVGPNASGKTTLLRTIAGRHAPIRGAVRIAGRDLHAGHGGITPPPGFAIPVEELPPFLTIAQSLSIYASAHGLPGVPAETTALATTFNLDAHAHVLVRDTSLGTRQKLSIMLALMLQPSLLLLDEVFNGLDFASALQLRDWLRQRVDAGGLSIIMATHALDVVLRCCDSVLLLEDGKLGRQLDVKAFTGATALPDLEQALAQGN